ncbi:MAG: TonB-dependent receptor [Gammaproteobacteria bacterium]|nr:TonB-dependent receptor [Gammaproteobacteria bacterium]
MPRGLWRHVVVVRIAPWERRARGLFGVGLLALIWTVCAERVAHAASEAASAETSDQLVEVVVTVGTRAKARAAADTAVPVDVFDREQLESVNSSDLVDVLNDIVPSFSVRRQPISDGASFIRPVHLRGLDSHHMLVLVDGKRRHRSALMQLGGFGAHGVDVGSIPSIAVEAVEVLRDGAAAQYGSDAIAGVMNFRLKRYDSGFDVRARAGGYARGDGEELALEANVGFPLGAAGFLNVSGQFSDAAPTSRSQPYDIAIGNSGITPLEATGSRLTVDGVTYFGPDALTCTYSPGGDLLQAALGSDGIPDDLDTRFADNFHLVGGDRRFPSPAQVWGQPERRQGIVVANAELPVLVPVRMPETAPALSAALYGFASYSTKDQTGGFFYRRPGVSQLLPVRLEDGSIYDPRATLYPAGFTPQFAGDVTDYAVRGGFRGERRRVRSFDLTFDFSVSYGGNEIRYSIANTMNPSMGPQSPTRFRPGTLVNDEYAANADFVITWQTGLASPLNVAFGFEQRREGYAIEAGDPPSYEVGPFARPDPFNFEITQAEVDADGNDDLTVVECRIPGFEAIGALCPDGDPVNNALPIGSNGFPGYPPLFTSDLDRDSYAGYLDLEVDLAEHWLADFAARYEDFSDFGNVGIWKLATRYRLTDDLKVRGSLGSGFRAPTPGQISTTNVSTRIDPSGFPRAEGVFPPAHPAAALFGGLPLDAEHSHSWTLGAAASIFEGLDLTVDLYRIRLDSRIVLSSQFSVGPGDAARLVALGVPGASDIAQVRFFTNDVDTRTRGIDVVAVWRTDWSLGSTSLQAAVNFNRTDFTRRGDHVDAEAEHDIERGAPDASGVVTVTHTRNRLDLLLRARYYGAYENSLDASLATVQGFSREVMVDVEATWSFRDRYAVKLGAQNLFDNYPDPGEFETCCGRIYRSDSVPPWQGALVYLQASVSSR